MSNSAGPQKQSRMIADREDPWISVSLLAENAYCSRAGIIQNETGLDDTGEELFHLGRGRQRLVFYDFKQLVRALKRTFTFTVCSIIVLIFSIVAGQLLVNSPALWKNMVQIGDLELHVSWYDVAQASFNVIMIISLICVGYGILRWLYIYLFRYLPAKWARAAEPNPLHTEAQTVKWWGLLNAGFQVIRPQDQYRDVRWHLAGCPWRVLVKGNLRIPVYKKRPNRGNAGEKLFRQHYARMAAYCHLLEKCENADSPYGIILFGDSHIGITVPCLPGTKKTFHDGLIDARKTISYSKHFLPPYPKNPQICVLCPHSRRERYTGASVCGNRFGWIPPNYRDAYAW